MRKHIFQALLIAAVSVLAACGSVQSFTFEQLYPAEVTYPAGVSHVAVVNNMPSAPAPKGDVLTAGMHEGDGKIAAETLAGALADSRYFSQVVICDSALCPEDIRTEAPMLTQAQVEELCASLEADMLFSVERVALQTAKREVFYPDFPMPFEVLEVKTRPTVRIYIPSRSKPMVSVSRVDSLYWDLLPDLSDRVVVRDATSDAISALMPVLVPHWGEVSRLFYDSGSVEMRDAAVCVRENDWAEAKRLWQQLYDSRKKGRLKAKAAFNMALACEMEGSLDEASGWLDKAKGCVSPGSEEERVADYYQKVLEGKRKDLPKLDMQMKRF